ncbi:rubrerythrin family protein [Desulfohalovibrio reitneri]|uniref:rubrerythrin family protein n=1 Tax=Desulfohalovibrio reitneri TaxID=1307759 RepID=UPI0004A70697|nr:rubrerythrin family protein [Desulfohalovibrio reitneri]
MSKTEDNLQQAFAGESMANRRYLAYASQAAKEGHPKVAKLFRAVAEAETIHAHNHLRILGEIKDTAENLREALGGEEFEFKEMYPEMIEQAQEEGNKQAERTFNFANEVEKIHAKLYQDALDKLGQDENADVTFHVCGVCGYTVEGEAPDTCPVCSAKKKMFFEVE